MNNDTENDQSSEERQKISKTARLLLCAKPFSKDSHSIQEADCLKYCFDSNKPDRSPSDFPASGRLALILPIEDIELTAKPGEVTDGRYSVLSAMSILQISAADYDIRFILKNNIKQGIALEIDETAYRKCAVFCALTLASAEHGSEMLGYSKQQYQRLMKNPDSVPSRAFNNMLEYAKPYPEEISQIMASAAKSEFFTIATAMRDRLKATEHPRVANTVSPSNSPKM